MKKILVMGLLLGLASFNVAEKDVYLCGPRGSSKYHFSETCRGLNSCKHEVTKKKLSEAKELGLTLCGWED